MLNSVLVDLRGERSWSPAGITVSAFEWPVDSQTVLVRDFCATVTARSFADEGSSAVTPTSLDPMTGGIRRRSPKFQGPVFQVGAELRPGDLLVPRRPDGTILHVDDFHDGALVSATFTALRPVDQETSLWVWAVLNSTSGQRLRRTYAAGTVNALLTASAVLDLPVPLRPAPVSGLIREISAVEQSTHIEEVEAVSTWWRRVDLRSIDWQQALATPHPELLAHGEPLSDFCEEIRRGRPVRQFASEHESPGDIGVMDIGVLNGRAPRRWVPSDNDSLVRIAPGDVVIAAVGERAYATVADASWIADQNVFVLRLVSPTQAHALARYLNGRDGFAMRKIFLAGMIIPSLRKSDLVRFPVRPEALAEPVEPAVGQPLAARLEQLLWNG